jgi:hypothetical protein
MDADIKNSLLRLSRYAVVASEIRLKANGGPLPHRPPWLVTAQGAAPSRHRQHTGSDSFGAVLAISNEKPGTACEELVAMADSPAE